jgi:hypothetical protein
MSIEVDRASSPEVTANSIAPLAREPVSRSWPEPAIVLRRRAS